MPAVFVPASLAALFPALTRLGSSALLAFSFFSGRGESSTLARTCFAVGEGVCDGGTIEQQVGGYFSQNKNVCVPFPFVCGLRGDLCKFSCSSLVALLSCSLSAKRAFFSLLRVLLAGPSESEAESSSVGLSSSDVTLLFSDFRCRKCGLLRVVAALAGPFPVRRGCPLESVVPSRNTRSLKGLLLPEKGGA